MEKDKKGNWGRKEVPLYPNGRTHSGKIPTPRHPDDKPFDDTYLNLMAKPL
jgi:hypothetical protein